MEDFNWGGLLDVILPVATAGLAIALGWALTKLRKVVKESDNKFDDAALKAIEEAFENSKKSQ